MSKKINTVTGEISNEMLGKTLMHEHFFFSYPGIEGDESCKHQSKKEVMDKAIKVAKKMISNGFKTVIDATPNECGRDPEWLKELAEATGLQIICSTGYYHEGISGNGYWTLRSMVGDAVKELQELMIRELTVGIRDTGIKAGVIKLASQEGKISDYEKNFFIAGAKAQKKTGAVIITHTTGGTMGLEQAKLLLENGADPKKVVIGHMCGKIDADYHEKIINMGFNVGFDRIGQQFGTPNDSERLNLLKELLDRGRINHIVISHDVVVNFLGRPFEWPNPYKPLFANYHTSYISETFIPMMRDAGITDNQINQIFIDNPKRIFG